MTLGAVRGGFEMGKGWGVRGGFERELGWGRKGCLEMGVRLGGVKVTLRESEPWGCEGWL